MFEVRRFSSDAFPDELARLREQYAETGRYPFVIGEEGELERLPPNAVTDMAEVRKTIDDADSVNLAGWFAERRAEIAEYISDETELMGAWPVEPAQKMGPTLHRHYSGRPFDPVLVGLAAVDEPWQLPAVVGVGGWNECPEAEVQCAVWRDWATRFGARITGIAGDVIEGVVTNPPTDRESAMSLAWEQYWYCEDIVTQGCGSISALASSLLDGPCWYFWWD